MRYGLIELGSVEQLMFPVKLVTTVLLVLHFQLCMINIYSNSRLSLILTVNQ